MGEHGGVLENIESIENNNMGNMVNMNLVFSAIFRDKVFWIWRMSHDF